MSLVRVRRLSAAVVFACVCGTAPAAGPVADASDPLQRLPDHYEFDATLDADFAPDARGLHHARLSFDYPAGSEATLAAWQVDLLSPQGVTVQSLQGETPLAHGRGRVTVALDGKRDAAGFYTVRLRAVPAVVLAGETDEQARIQRSFALAQGELIEQTYDIRIGNVPAPAMPAFLGLPRGSERAKSAPATGSLPYIIYYGNLHSQTNHSDGGTVVSSCGGSEVPQGGTQGPAQAYAMMDTQAGGDFLLASEHNHMYDGSTGTNTSASPATANNLFASGISAANSYTSAHPDFVALYGNEWGVISNGGHLNIINPDALPSWEYNSSNQLIGSVATVKSDYAQLYGVMKARGWIGQFNHPSSSQFAIGGTGMAYNADGAQVMVLAEIMNTSAFSTNTTQTETSRSTYSGAFNLLLERGYKVAPATNQDNHCANWGLSFRNRTGVLLPNTTSLSRTAFIDALKARRVFASEDKAAQLILTANGAVMGQTISNSGALTLTANYASSAGGSASRVQFFEGVPGRNGTVTQLYEGSGTRTITPATGAHFYYALVTEADGDRLWSAPIWVNQGTGGGNVTPTANYSFTVSGLSATFTDSSSDSDGSIASRSWNFGDGTTSTATNPSKTWSAAGTYSVTLTVTDNGGLTNATTKSVAVTSGGGGGTVLSNGVPVTGLAATTGNSLNYTMVVPSGATNLQFVTSGGTGDMDMYVKFGSAPTDSSYDCRPYATGNAETCTFATAQAGTYYVRLKAYSSFSGLSLTGSYTTGGGGGGTQTYTNSTDYTINDNATVDSPITVSGRSGNAPSNASVTVAIVHTYQGDLKVDLVAPDGSLYNIHNRTGSGTDNINKTVTLNLSSETLNGTWKLRVNDNASGDTGYINSWSVTF